MVITYRGVVMAEKPVVAVIIGTRPLARSLANLAA
jgi:hypothetical protein